MKVKGLTDLGNIKDPQEFIRHGSIAIGDITKAVNGNLSFDTNLNTRTVTVTFDQPNVEQAVTHNLGRVPLGYLASKMSTNMVVYDGSRDATSTVSYLKSSAAGTITLIFH